VLEWIEAMFRTIGDGPPSWELLLPPELLRLPGELARVDALLDDPVFFAPFAPHFHPVLGRPSTPVECYLRLMFLKFRHRLGYESLCAEVSDSISWRRLVSLHGPDARPIRKGRIDKPVEGVANPAGYSRSDRRCAGWSGLTPR
jgi:transposase-like protein DUF772